MYIYICSYRTSEDNLTRTFCNEKPNLDTNIPNVSRTDLPSLKNLKF